MPRPHEDDFDDEDEDEAEGMTADEWRMAFYHLEETLNYALVIASAVTGYPALFFLPDQGEEYPQ